VSARPVVVKTAACSKARSDGGGDVHFHADVGIYEHSEILNSGDRLDKDRAYMDCLSRNPVLTSARRTPQDLGLGWIQL